MKKFLFSFIVMVWAGLAPGQSDREQLFQAANQAYDRKDYAQAVEKYQALWRQGVSSSALFYNLGNAYFRVGKLGESILCYRKALILSPGDKDLKENLEFARLYRTDKIAESRGFFLLAWLAGLPGLLGLDTLSFLVSLCWWILLAGLMLYFVYKKKSQLVQAGVVGSLVLFSLSGISLWQGLKAGQKKFGVILSPQTEAKSGPGSDYVSLFQVNPGLECTIEEERENWYLVSLPNGSRGWVPSGAMGLI